MSLFSRLLGLSGSRDEREEPESVRLIARELDGLPDERARFLAAYAYLLARVAHADMSVDASTEALKTTLSERGESCSTGM